jgi:RNA polymerase sigma-54 factor
MHSTFHTVGDSMKTSLHATMNQQIGMTPQLLQSIRLLHLTAMEVEQEVNRALDDNPLLERVDVEADEADDTIAAEAQPSGDALEADDMQTADDFDDYVPGDYTAASSSHLSASDDYDPFANIAGSDNGGIRGAIREQLKLELTSNTEFDAACWLLDNTDDAGYLELPLAELIDSTANKFEIAAATVEGIRQRILRCEPAGFGSADLRECLLVQLSESQDDADIVERAILIVANHLDVLALRNVEALAELIRATIADTNAAIALIQTLDPKPGAKISNAEGNVIVPDVVVMRRGDGWHVALNAHAAPRVRVDAETERLLAKSGDSESSRRLRDLLGEARWMSRGLSMRYETLLRTTRAIIERQAEFLEHGEESMKPLILREIAAQIGMHESSISRITTGKYMQTPRGTFELKYFFSAKLEGSQVAGIAVRAMVKRLIDTENREAPLADDTIVALLARRGVRVARRTIAKYRDLMDIAPAKERAARFTKSAPYLTSAAA